MERVITREQLEEIEDALFLLDRETAYDLLEEYAGIRAKPYTAWMFYDEADNWLGDSDNYSVRDLIEISGISVEEKGDGQ